MGYNKKHLGQKILKKLDNKIGLTQKTSC